MKIKQLEIKNIASIENAFVDFEAYPLKDSDVFLITGKIGAGKSTLLDAICLALYGTTPRVSAGVREKIEVNPDGLSGRDPRQLMRQNTGEAYVRLTFEGTDGNSYIAEWQVQRGKLKKPTSALNTDVWTLKNLTTGEELSGSTSNDKGVSDAVQKAVGLNFDQFCRTTMLAQGEFTKFLKSDEKEKASILEKITGTKIYSKIGAKIYDITKEKRDALKTETDKLSGITLLKQEEIDAKQLRIKEIDEENKLLVKQWEKALGAHRDLKDLEDGKAEIQRLENEISGPLKQRYLTGLKGRRWLESRLVELQEQQKNVADRIDSQKDKAPIYEKSQTILQLLREIYKAQQQIQQKKAQRPTLDTALDVADKASQAKQKDYEALKKQYVEQEKAVAADEEQLKSMDLPLLRKQKEDLKETVNAIVNLQTRWSNHTSQAEKLAENEKKNKELGDEINQLNSALPQHQEALRAGKELLASLETLKDLSAQTVNQWAKQIRSTLKEGCVCPVCQQTLQRALPVEAELDKAYQLNVEKFNQQKAQVEALQDRLNKLMANIDAKKRQHTQNEESLSKAKLELQREEQRFLADAAKYGVTDAQQAAAVLASAKQAKDDEFYQIGLRVEEAEKFEKQLNEKKKQLSELSKRGTLALDAKNKAEKAVVEARNAINTIEATLAELDKSVQAAELEVDGHLGTTIVWPYDWRTQTADFGNMLKAETQQYNQDKESLKGLEQQGKETDKTLQGVKDIQHKINQLHGEWAVLTVDEAEAVPRQEELWNGLFANLSTALQLKEQAKQKKQKAEQQLEDFSKDCPLDELESQIKSIEQKINDLKKESVEIANILETDAAQSKDKKALEQRVAVMREDFAQWKRLCDYFGNADGSVFQQIAQSFILGNLLHSANTYLQSLHRRYSLEVVPGTLHISLVDAYQGYASRLVTSLSGGESFLVSLALALALADIGQNLAVDTLFVDEGFGSLSGQELLNAINTLRALHRANGRHVGIISHIESVKGSIPVQIQVIQEGNNSSSVVKVGVEN